MDKRKNRNQIQNALNTTLSGLQDDPWLAQRVIAEAKGEVKVKKKISVGLVVALIAVLLAATATAAVWLTVRQIVEEQAIPMANQYEGESYTVEDTDHLVQLAQENGIELSEETKAKIEHARSQGEGYFKEELLMAMAKAEFGENPMSWTLAQQKWFDDVCVAIGFIPEAEAAMPTENEIAQEVAISQAQAYIYEHFDASVALNDAAVYQLGVQYINGRVDGFYDGNYWSICYMPLTFEGNEYWIYVDPAGEILDCTFQPGIAEGCHFMTVYDRFRKMIGSPIATWSQAELRTFRETLDHCAPSYERMYLAFMQVDYPEPSASEISKEQAERAGAEALGLTDYTLQSAVYIKAPSEEVWRIHYYVQTDSQNYQNYAVDVDAQTGSILFMEQENTIPAYYGVIPQSVFDSLKNIEAPSVG